MKFCKKNKVCEVNKVRLSIIYQYLDILLRMVSHKISFTCYLENRKVDARSMGGNKIYDK